MMVYISDNFGRLSIRLFSPLWLFKTSCICVLGYFGYFFSMGKRKEVLDAIKEKNLEDKRCEEVHASNKFAEK